MTPSSLDQATFLIPVKYDCLERVRNLKIVLRFLAAHGGTRVHVLETGASGFFAPHLADAGATVRYDFVRDDQPFFYKTRLLNDMLGQCRTEVAVIYDADIVCHPANLHRACRFVLDDADIALPYSGLCLDVPGNLVPRLLGPPKDFPGPAECRPLYADATGGVVFFKTTSLRRAGGYNEHFKSWGHEDRELLHRMRALGYRLKTLSGHIAHMRHPRSRDSHPDRNPFYAENCREYEKVLAMDRAMLESYVAGFPWLARLGTP